MVPSGDHVGCSLESALVKIDLDSQTVEILNTHRLSQAESKLMLGPTYNDNDLLYSE